MWQRRRRRRQTTLSVFCSSSFFQSHNFYIFTKKRAKIIFTMKKIVQSRKSGKVSPVLKRKGLSSTLLLLCVRPLLHAIYYFEKNKRKRGHLMMRSHQTISLVIVFGNFSNPPNIPLDLNDCPLSPAEIFDGSMMTCLMFARRHVYVT